LLAIFVMLVIFTRGKFINFYSYSSRLIVGVFFIIYWIYFFIVSIILTGDIQSVFSSMKGNLPLLVVALICLTSNCKNFFIDVQLIGRWCTLAIWAIFFISFSLTLARFIDFNFAGEWQTRFWQGGRLELFARNPLMFASIVMLIGYWGMLGFQEKSKFEKRLSVVALFMVFFIILFLAQARGASLVWLCLLLPFAWLQRKSLGSYPNVIKSGSFLFLTFVCFLFILFIFDSNVFSRYVILISDLFSNGGEVSDSISTRQLMYRNGLMAAVDGGFFGYGYQNRFVAILPLLGDQINYSHGHLHNEMLNNWVAGGVIGLLFFIAFTILPIFLVVKAKTEAVNLVYAAYVLSLSMFGIGLTTAVLGHYVHTILFGACIATLAMLLDQEGNPPHLQVSQK
jgi:O-antigen ligase